MRSLALGAAPQCDPFWSAMNAGCSDEFGNYFDQTGNPISSQTLSQILRGVPPAGTAGDPPPAEKCPPFTTKPLEWFKCGNNGLYAAAGVFGVVLSLALMKGRK